MSTAMRPRRGKVGVVFTNNDFGLPHGARSRRQGSSRGGGHRQPQRCRQAGCGRSAGDRWRGRGRRIGEHRRHFRGGAQRRRPGANTVRFRGGVGRLQSRRPSCLPSRREAFVERGAGGLSAAPARRAAHGRRGCRRPHGTRRLPCRRGANRARRPPRTWASKPEPLDLPRVRSEAYAITPLWWVKESSGKAFVDLPERRHRQGRPADGRARAIATSSS